MDGVPLFGSRFSKTVLTSFAIVPGAEYGKNKLTYMEDTYLTQSHVGTHLDGMGHIGIKDCYYNQTPMGKYVTQNYLKKLGLEHSRRSRPVAFSSIWSRCTRKPASSRPIRPARTLP